MSKIHEHIRPLLLLSIALAIGIGLSLSPVASAYAQCATTSYVVRSGDSLAAIARQHGISYQALARYNGVSNPNRIYVGQTLRIPSSAACVPAVPTLPAPGSANPTPTTPPPQPTPPSNQTAPSSPPAARSQPSVIAYTVRAGNSLSGIALQFHTTVEAIMLRNNLPSTRIYVGQRLFIPISQ
jgi:LysM repeat protein